MSMVEHFVNYMSGFPFRDSLTAWGLASTLNFLKVSQLPEEAIAGCKMFSSSLELKALMRYFHFHSDKLY